MKKYTLALGLLALITTPALAEKKKTTASKTVAKTEVVAPASPQAPSTADAATLSPEDMAFREDLHDFGNVQEGGDAEFDFVFTNTGKEPIIIQRAQPACGCTASEWTKEPILPGKTGFVRASYHTQGRPGPFNKTVTVLSNAGAKVLTFKGEVEKAPSGSFPEQQSIIKTN